MQIREQFAIHGCENTSGSPSSASINAVEHVLGGASREPPDNSNSSVSSAPRAADGSWWLLEFFNVSVGSLRSCLSADVTLDCRYLWGPKECFLWVHMQASSVGCVCVPACILWVYVCYHVMICPHDTGCTRLAFGTFHFHATERKHKPYSTPWIICLKRRDSQF